MIRDSIVSNGNGFGIWIESYGSLGRSKNTTISNCYIEIKYNSLNNVQLLGGQDPIYIRDDDGGNTLINNYIISHDVMGYAASGYYSAI